MKNSKRIISLLLTILCIVSIIPIPLQVSASETTSSLPNGVYQIKNVQTGLYMSAPTDSSSSIVKQYIKDNEPHQQFLVTYLGNGEYIIQPININESVVCVNSSIIGMAAVVSTYSASNDYHRFYISKAGTNTYYSIENKGSGNVLSMYPGDTSGATVSQSAYVSTNLYHHWYFERIHVNSGIFAFQVYMTNTYVANDNIKDGSLNVYAKNDFSSVPDSKSERNGLFKFIYRPDNNDYVIRTMINNKIMICARTLSSEVYFKENADTEDVNIESDFTWNVSRAGTELEYHIWHQPEGSMKRYFITVSSSNKRLSLTTDMSKATIFTLRRCTASFEAITPVVKDCHVIDAGTSIDLSTFRTESYFASTNLTKNAYTGNITCAVTDLNGNTTSIAQIENSTSLKTFASKAGMVKVTVTFPGLLTFTTNFYITPSDTSDFFFLQNDEDDCDLPIGFITANGTTAEKSDFTYSDNQIWERIQSSSGYFYIRNVKTGYYLLSPSSTTIMDDILLSSEPSGTRSEWQFTKTSAGGWNIRSKYHATAGRNLYLNIQGYTDNSLVQDTAVSNLSYLDEFNVIEIGLDVVYHRSLSSNEFTDISITSEISSLAKHYDSFSLMHEYININVNTAKDLLDNAKIAIINGHGTPSTIIIHDNLPKARLNDYDIYYKPTSTAKLDLSNLDIVFFAGCSTAGNPCSNCQDKGIAEGHDDSCSATTYSFNITESAQKAGAKVAIGWKFDTEGNYMNEWIREFLECLNTVNSKTNQLHTVQEAFANANSAIITGGANTAKMYTSNVNFRLSDF